MQARVVPTLRGANWLAEGFRLFRAGPFTWLALVLAYWILVTIISVLPVIGVVVASIMIPAFSVGFMAASRAADRGQALEFSLLFAGFRVNLVPQLAVGVAYLVLIASLLGATALADDGALARWMLSGRRPEAEVLQSGDFLAAMMLAAALYMPVMMLLWFAPVLVSWHSVPVAKALFFSFFASLMNWRAFLAYGMAVALVTVVIPFGVLLALMAVSGGSVRMSAVSLVFPLLLALLPTLFASFYASYRDVFGEHASQPPGA